MRLEVQLSADNYFQMLTLCEHLLFTFYIRQTSALVLCLTALTFSKASSDIKRKSSSPVRTCRARWAQACRSPWWQSQVRWRHCNTGKRQWGCGGPRSGSALMKQHKEKDWKVIWRLNEKNQNHEDSLRSVTTSLTWWCICLFGPSVSLSAPAPKWQISGRKTVCAQRVERSLMALHFIQLADAFVQSDLQFFPTCTHQEQFGVQRLAQGHFSRKSTEPNLDKAGFIVDTRPSYHALISR